MPKNKELWELLSSTILQIQKFNSPKLNCDFPSPTYLYDRSRNHSDIIINDIGVEQLNKIYKSILNEKTKLPVSSIVDRLINAFKGTSGGSKDFGLAMNFEFLRFMADDTEALREKKRTGWCTLIDTVLSQGKNKKDFTFDTTVFENISKRIQNNLRRDAVGTQTAVILSNIENVQTMSSSQIEFYCGNYYLYYIASDADHKIRGGRLQIFRKEEDPSRIFCRLLLRISNEQLMYEENLEDILNPQTKNPLEKLKQITKKSTAFSRCEYYEGDVKLLNNHIRIDFTHNARGYSGFLLLHVLPANTQTHLQACLGIMMNQPDDVCIFFRKTGLVNTTISVKYSFSDSSLFKYLDTDDTSYLLISKSHQSENHNFYTHTLEINNGYLPDQ